MLKKAEEAYQENFDKHIIRQLAFKVGDLVYLNEPHNNQQVQSDGDPSRNLQPEKTGPYEVKHINPNTDKVRINDIEESIALDQLSIATQVDDRSNGGSDINRDADDNTGNKPSSSMTAMESTKNMKEVPQVKKDV